MVELKEPRPRQRKFAPRSRQGCLTCRTRRKRCDGNRPECQGCTRLNLKCQWQTQRQIVPDPATPSSPASAVLNVTSPLLPSIFALSIKSWEEISGENADEARYLLHYYQKAFVPSISVADTPSSFYTSLYMPMALKSEKGLLDAIVALSSGQLARRSSDPDRARYLLDVSTRHQTRSHAFLRDRLSPSGQPLTDASQVVGVILLLVGLEALNGNKGTKWLSQMDCARKILSDPHTQEQMSPWELDSLRRHFTYYDVMASVMAPVSKSYRFSPDRRYARLYQPGEGLTIDPLMGISDQLCSLVCRIQYMTTSTPAFPHLCKAAFEAIERDIKQWKYENPLTSPELDLPVALDLIALAEAYRLAALIQLYRTSTSSKELIADCASRAMQFIARIPPGSPAESSLLYPILLAGAELRTEAEISLCRERLTMIQRRNHYENVANLRDLLQEVWKPVLNGGEKRDWEEILREWDWSFSLA
ncbi:uncharacterized protein EI97DRAFT_281783 [Westerdykella ornata]|uniref:Zn(2)-C6 fungal-type domain-containing protein n=1 Tax=Westerdykella ornata TaxID=318751 RepID=A0A6A6JN01_WESOR|nr:uncharacterized protein EI97DRAFT_281783 [Westerdykella ornata]KAF2278030.1 hypothetical protein EI97DRAFT_281783 [Westerdykella ornata]